MKKRVSLITLTVSCILVFLATYAIPRFSKAKKREPVAVTNNCPLNMDQIRIKSLKYTQPLLLANLMTESNTLSSLRNKVEQYVTQAKSNQQLEDITVYVRQMNNGSWFCINPNQTYNPASMSKIIYLITYLKEAEYNPSVINKKIYFAKHFSEGNQPNIKDFSLQENAYYTVKDLLIYMIKYSDNDATLLLSQNMNQSIYQQLFVDLNLPPPPTVGEYYITALDYSKLMRILYNASYIRPEYSEFGLSVLTLSTYADGLRKGLDPSIEMAHKFGERIMGNKAQLHEFGIIYLKDEPYMLGIMTKGTSLPQLSVILGDISRIVYSDFVSKRPA